jgi:hypothetical protein
VRVAINLGYLKNLEDRKGRPARLVVGENMPEDAEVLPPVEGLKVGLNGCAVDRDSQRGAHPPPPSATELGLGGAREDPYPSNHTATDQPEDDWEELEDDWEEL